MPTTMAVNEKRHERKSFDDGRTEAVNDGEESTAPRASTQPDGRKFPIVCSILHTAAQGRE